MGEYGPLTRETSNPAPGAVLIIDAVALEERLKVARELRAQAIARRQAVAPRAAPSFPPPRTAQRPPLVDPVALVPTTPVPATPVPEAATTPTMARRAPEERPRGGLRVAHPLAALLALGLTLSSILSRDAPEAAPPAAIAAAPAKAPPPAPDRQAEVAPREPEVAAAAPDAEPAPEALPPAPAPPAVDDLEIETASAAPPAAFDPIEDATLGLPAPDLQFAPTPEPAPAAAPRPERILVNAPPGAPSEAVAAAVAALRGRGFAEVADQPTRLTISASSVRYYNAEDEAAAAEIAALVGPLLPGGAAARDFTAAPTRGAPGHLEIWVAGGAPVPTRSAARPAPDELQRLVRGVLSAPVVENVGRGVANAARDLDSALGDAFRALEGGR